ncbi:Pentatricopeptide repeat-containing protein [Musa troglodytarum]|uniref:Pentatricopeptide repeat-containing protein n=2 Tax=Musa troglodytarum TaxID=320322 RepID=A0A9E7KYF9_9LILI|nr:Pentatricopeptide repeat-containing protein [Musa troglodytarum]
MCNAATDFRRHSLSVHKCSPTARVEYQPSDLAATWTNRGGSPSDPFSPAGAPPRRRGGGGAAGLIPEQAMAPPWAPTTSATSSVARREPSCSAASRASSMRRPIPGRFPSTTSSSARRSGREGSLGRQPGGACRRSELPRAGLVRTEEGFYDDIFGSEGGGRGRKSRSKSSSSVLSSEDMSPPIRMAASMAEDAVLSSFASKLRPITIPSRRYVSSPSANSREEWNSHRTPSMDPYLDSRDCKKRDHSSSELLRQRSHISFSCCFSPPETISLEASFRRSQDEPTGCDNSDADSPSSVISSVFLDPVLSKADRGVEGHREAAESSYVIEINGHGMGGKEGAAAIDEAIAWAKQKFWDHQMSKGLDEPLQPEDEIKGKENPVGIC